MLVTKPYIKFPDSFSPSPPPSNWPTFGKNEASLPPPTQDKPNSAGDALLAGPSGGMSSTNASGPKVPDRKDSLKDIPPELQGVSVKDLVKALGE